MAVDHPFDLSGRLAVVTGSGSGLGLAIARGLARAGARVVINGRNRARLDAAATALVADGHAASVCAFDVTDEAAVSAGMAEIERTLGPVDILVNNAAINIRKPFDEYTLAEWRTLQDANFDGPFLVARTVVPGMKARRRGKIINICSLASDIGRAEHRRLRREQRRTQDDDARAGRGTGAAQRAGQRHLAGVLQDGDEQPLIGNAEFSAWVEKRTPAGRWGDPPEIAGAAVFLASDAANYVTGHLLYVDGGFSAAY